MPRFRVRQSWTEVNQHHNEIEIEADDEEQARDIANDNMDLSDSEFSDGDTDNFEVVSVVPLDEDGAPLKKHKRKAQRNLPVWW